MTEFYSYLSSQPKTPLIEGVIKIYNVLFESVVSRISLYRNGQYVDSAQNIEVADDWAEADPCQVYTITDQNGIEHLWGSSLNNTDEIERNWIRDDPGSGDITRQSYRRLKERTNSVVPLGAMNNSLDHEDFDDGIHYSEEDPDPFQDA